MAQDYLLAAKALFQQGQFSKALEFALRVPPGSKAAEAEKACLVCECVQYKGDFDRALAEAHDALKKDLSAEHAARYWDVIGRIRVDQAKREEASDAFRKAVRAAEKSSDHALRASIQQELLITVAENLGAGLPAAVRDAYRAAVKSADAGVLAGFHLRMSRLEGQRGNFPQALHHLSLAKSLLERVENIALNALYHVNRSCVLALIGSFEPARKNAELGANLAEQAGHVRLALAATGNVAYIAISAGDLSVADSWLRKARKAAKELGVHEVALLDSYASLALVQGRYDDAAAYLRESRKSFAEDLKWVSSTEALSFFTELYLHKKQGDREQCANVLGIIRKASASLNDRHSEVLVTLAEAEFAFDDSRHDDGRAKLLELLKRAPIHPVYRADVNRVLARDLWTDGRVSPARRHLLRAAATSFLRGTRMSWGEALRELRALPKDGVLDPIYGIDAQQRLAETKFPALLNQPGPCWYATTTPRASTDRDCLDGFSDAIAILDTNQDAELRGREALATIATLRIAKKAALLARTESGLRVITAHNWPTSILERTLREDPSVVRMEVGTQDSRLIEVAVVPTPDTRALIALAGIRRLLEATTALEVVEKDRPRIGVLWQPEVIIEEPNAVFSSPQMIELMQTARKVGATTLPVLLVGDTGTGKEVLARAIHRASPRASKTFLPFNCSAVPRDMVESQLFGFRKGSFTGADHDFLGIIRSAEGGTLFLDEIGELSIDLQPKLLRFLETNEVHPIGEGKPIKVDVRIIAATNADLDDLIQRKLFREDLYYRLNIVRFQIPQLSERREEIPPLVMHMLRRFEMDEKKHSIKLSDELMEYLLLYKWPGNVRQLSNELRKMVAMVNSGETVGADHLAPAIRATRRTVDAEADAPQPTVAAEPTVDSNNLTVKLDQPLPAAVEALERAMIEHAIARADGGIEEAARLLGISRKGLFLKRRRWQADESH